jgi:hypothetical protein
LSGVGVGQGVDLLEEFTSYTPQQVNPVVELLSQIQINGRMQAEFFLDGLAEQEKFSPFELN